MQLLFLCLSLSPLISLVSSFFFEHYAKEREVLNKNMRRNELSKTLNFSVTYISLGFISIFENSCVYAAFSCKQKDFVQTNERIAFYVAQLRSTIDWLRKQQLTLQILSTQNDSYSVNHSTNSVSRCLYLTITSNINRMDFNKRSNLS